MTVMILVVVSLCTNSRCRLQLLLLLADSLTAGVVDLINYNNFKQIIYKEIQAHYTAIIYMYIELNHYNLMSFLSIYSHYILVLMMNTYIMKATIPVCQYVMFHNQG